jgi:hypothetical protein
MWNLGVASLDGEIVEDGAPSLAARRWRAKAGKAKQLIWCLSSVASVGFVVTPDFEADETVGISANDFAIHDYGLARIDRRLRVVLLGVGLRKRRGCHDSGEGDGGQSNSQVRFHVQPHLAHLEFIVQCSLHSANSAADKRAFVRASVQKNSLFIRI